MICVLVVDPLPDVRLAFAFMLDDLGCKVAEAGTGEDALRYLAGNRVDVVLADLHLPDMDGLALIEAIRKRPPPHPKIIALAGSRNSGPHTSVQAAGADAVLERPVSRDTLQATVRDLMRDPRDKRRGR